MEPVYILPTDVYTLKQDKISNSNKKKEKDQKANTYLHCKVLKNASQCQHLGKDSSKLLLNLYVLVSFVKYIHIYKKSKLLKDFSSYGSTYFYSFVRHHF